MNYPTVSFIIPTLGRDSLQKTFQSIETWEGDEVLVINLDLPPKGWGGRERNVGIAQAKCDYLAFIDDDDWYLSGHRLIMDEAARDNVKKYPVIFRMQYPSGRVLWEEPHLRCGNVGTPMIFVPNVKEMFPVWGDEHHADFNWLNSLGWQARKFIWHPEILVQLGHEDLRWWSYQKEPYVGQRVYSEHEPDR